MNELIVKNSLLQEQVDEYKYNIVPKHVADAIKYAIYLILICMIGQLNKLKDMDEKYTQAQKMMHIEIQIKYVLYIKQTSIFIDRKSQIGRTRK